MPTTEAPSGPFSALHTDGLPTPTSIQKKCGISPFYITYTRALGDARFTVGVFKELIFKNGYPCSFATCGALPLPEAVDANANEAQRRVAKKATIQQHYQTRYNAQVPGSLEASGGSTPLTALVGTKRPMIEWVQNHSPCMYSFYAGKVFLSDAMLMERCRGLHDPPRHFLLHYRMMDTLICAFFKAKWDTMQCYRSLAVSIKVSISTIQTYPSPHMIIF
jgi:hypothetical protein